jgi:beta-glucosidase
MFLYTRKIKPFSLLYDSGYAEFPTTPSKIEYDDGYRTEFLQSYLEVLYQSIQ